MVIEKKEVVITPLRLEREFIKKLKKRALDKNVSLQTWLRQAIYEKIAREDMAHMTHKKDS